MDEGAQPAGPPRRGFGASTPSLLSRWAMARSPRPSAANTKILRTTSASASTIRRTTCERRPLSSVTTTFS